MPTKALTEKDVESAKAAPGERLELWDSKSPGLCLRVTDRGVKTWVVRYRIGDRQPRMTLGTFPDLKLRDARDRASDVRRAARDGKDPAAEKREKAAAAKAEPIKSISDLADAYFRDVEAGRWSATLRGKKAGTLDAERRLWRGRLKPVIGDRRVDDFRKRDATAVIQGIAEAAPIQSNRARAFLSVMFRYAVDIERLAVNPVVGVKKIGREKARLRTLTDGELKAAWRGLCDPSGLKIEREGKKPVPVHISEATTIALRLAFLTLARRGELAAMRTADLRLDEGVWIQPDPKGGEPHLVPLVPQAVELIRAALALRADPESPYVFPSPWAKLAQPIDAGTLTHGLGDVFSALKIVDATLHDVRRTGASIMASERLAVPPVVVSKVLAHKGGEGGFAAVTSRHYVVHAWAKEKRAALESWAALLGSIVEGRAMPDNVTPLRA